MKVTSVICEYNPFHNGHQYMLHQLRKQGTTHIAAVMSGNFTQRGEAAVFDKFARTRAALMGGADLVIELPVSFACANAERFAYGGVFAAQALGCVDELAFGSESGDTALLQQTAAAVEDASVLLRLREILKSGVSYAAAREQAVREVYGDALAQKLGSPNDILGIEYCRALCRLHSAIRPVAVRREGAAHDSAEAVSRFASASLIRSMLHEGRGEQAGAFIPPECTVTTVQIPHGGRMKKLENILMYRLRTMTVQEMAELPEISEGLENRLYAAVRASETVEEVAAMTRSKRYPLARIRRILMYALLHIQKSALPPHPYYLRVLGMNQRGRELLKMAGKTATLPVIMRYADCLQNADTKSMFEQESFCDDIYALSGTKTLLCGANMTTPLVIEEI